MSATSEKAKTSEPTWSQATEQQLEALCRGVVDMTTRAELGKRIEKSLSNGKPLKIKAGFDPTRPDLHLGHSVVMNKMRQFQLLGHHIVFVVGDFTAAIGDPSGRNKTRPPLTSEEIRAGAQTYASQAFKILDANKTELAYNGTWLSPMGFADVIKLAAKYPLARMMERDDFKTRWRENSSISLHELLYPLAQGQDSVHLNCDVELGGTDQLFNLMVGRDLMRENGQAPQIVMTVPILEGLSARMENGKIVGDKMSKSLDNYVGVSEAPSEQFGKLMSISDDLMWRYYDLLSSEAPQAIADLRAACANGSTNPKVAKQRLAKEIVRRYHDDSAAESACAAWERQFSQREVPTDIPAVTLDTTLPLSINKMLALANLVPSVSEGTRRIEGGAVEVDGTRINDKTHALGAGTYLVKAGKRAWARITLR